ncbi:uncharacterized protein LOC133206058 [Saccostrea echinata]|uniref:uncharacterized protein LOC133206058 n=1 Tax=Saccostrea echinata TaxID=191078 RepID=UPI002A83825F|nr:uncharacterized protein LOC133206058 [Saccostrea echinata]
MPVRSMNMKVNVQYICFLIFISIHLLHCMDTSMIVKKLLEKVRNSQIQKTTKSLPPFSWHKEKGLFESHVKLYFHGSFSEFMLREGFEIFDNNNFATAWITTALLEVHQLGNNRTCIDEELILNAVKAMEKFVDKNDKFNTSVQTFWPQALNESVDTWQSTPENLLQLFALFDDIPWSVILNFLQKLHLADAEMIKNIKQLLQEKDTYIKAFHIPPDFDDTFVNIGMGSLLKEMSKSFPQSFKTWMKRNSNLTSVLTALKKYAYRPMSNDSKVDSIDPRTYFYMRGFLEKARDAGDTIALVPTWVQNTEEARKGFYKGNVMPFNINNVDITVAANAIYGLTNGILTGILPKSVIEDPDIQQIYLNTSALIAYEINTNLSNRRDLALTYYPSEYEFYWFVSRTFSKLQEYSQHQSLHPVMKRVREILGEALCGKMTTSILMSYKTDDDGSVFYDDFLGDGDRSIFNKTIERGEDRIFTTSMAINALLTTWTSYDSARKRLIWEKGVPAKVIDVVKRAVQWICRNALSGKYRPWNAFFSGSVKSFDSMPWWYPSNRKEYLNGTSIADDTHIPSDATIIAMQGVKSPEWYNTQLNKTHFGFNVPMIFNGYNAEIGPFPFWSSEPYTYVSAMLSLVKYSSVMI